MAALAGGAVTHVHTVSASSIARALPVMFEANRGQTDGRVHFLARGSDSTAFLTSQGIVLSVGTQSEAALPSNQVSRGVFGLRASNGGQTTWRQSHVLRLRWEKPAAHPSVVGLDRLPGFVNYFLGNDPARWRTGVPVYGAVEYHNLYPGTDLILYGNRGHLEYDWRLAPKADVSRIRLAVDGPADLRIDSQGILGLQGAHPAILQSRPLAYQTVNGARRLIRASYVLDGPHTFGIQLGRHDVARPLTIDPVLQYASYLGGLTDGSGIAVDSSGNVYVTGGTFSDTFPGPGGLEPFHGTSDTFVAKLNPAGNALVYGTYLGGTTSNPDRAPVSHPGVVVAPDTSTSQEAHAIAVDAQGNAYVTGQTQSSDFPTVNAVQPRFGGGVCPERVRGIIALSSCFDAYVTKLSPSGDHLIFSTYLGGTNQDWGNGIAVDPAGDAIVTGETRSSQFPLKNPLQATHPGMDCAAYGIGVPNPGAPEPCSDAFVTKFTSEGSLIFSTYLGGTSDDWGQAAATDREGDIYVAGTTTSSDFPTHNGFQATLSDPVAAAFVAKFSPNGDHLLYSTYFGGTESSFPTDIPETPASAEATATELPTASSDQTEIVPATETPSANGGTTASGIAVDSLGDAYITGDTDSTYLPTVSSIQSGLKGDALDAYVAELNPSGNGLVYSTYLGGTGWDDASGIAVDAGNNAYVTGTTESSDFPAVASLKPAPQPSDICPDPDTEQPSVCSDAFVSRIGLDGRELVYSTYLGGQDLDLAQAITLDETGNAYVTGFTFSSDLPQASVLPNQALIEGSQSGFVMKLYDTPSATLTPTPAPTATARPTQSPASLHLTVSGKLRVGEPATIHVSVRDSGTDQSVANAVVTLDGRKVGITVILRTKTNTRGAASFRRVRARRSGTITIKASKAGYTSRTIRLRVHA